MRFASGIECRAAVYATHDAVEILMNSHLVVTGAAKNSLCIKFVGRPKHCLVISKNLMAEIARIMAVAAFK